MSKDTIIKILITIIALMVFIWLWHIICILRFDREQLY